jgi:membrane protease YdiL (CAAX protease family)
LGSVLFSIILFLAVPPTVSDRTVDFFGADPPMLSDVFRPLILLASLLPALSEEIMFRLGIQTFLAKHLRWQGKRYWLAVLLTTAIWTLGHYGALEPTWVKLVQVFPMGLALGWVFRKYGLGSAILVHGGFNVIIVSLSGFLLT